jgi:hypothetical protein
MIRRPYGCSATRSSHSGTRTGESLRGDRSRFAPPVWAPLMAGNAALPAGCLAAKRRWRRRAASGPGKQGDAS